MWNTMTDVVMLLSCIMLASGQEGIPYVSTSSIDHSAEAQQNALHYLLEENIFVTLNAALSANISIDAPADTSECGEPINVTGSIQCAEEYSRYFAATPRAPTYDKYECREYYQIIYECKEERNMTTAANATAANTTAANTTAAKSSATEVNSDPNSLIDHNFDTIWAYKMKEDNPVSITLDFPEAFQVNFVVMAVETIPINISFYVSLNGDEKRIASYQAIEDECSGEDPLCFNHAYDDSRVIGYYFLDEGEPLYTTDKLRIVLAGDTSLRKYTINYLIIRDIYVSSTCACESGNCSKVVNQTSDRSKLAKYSCDCTSSAEGFLCDRCTAGFYRNSGECQDCNCGHGATNKTCNADGVCECESTLYDSNILFDTKCDTPYITTISPSGGPISGGTLVTIRGGLLSQLHLNLCTEVAKLCTDCASGDTELICKMPAGRDLGLVPLLTAGNSSGDNNMTYYFEYIAGYRITDIQPREAFVSGGRELTIMGNSLNYASSVTLVYGITCKLGSISDKWSIDQTCFVLNDTVAVCSSSNFCEIINKCDKKGGGVGAHCGNGNINSLGATAESVSIELTVNIDNAVVITGNSSLPFKVLRDPIINEWEKSLRTIARDALNFTVPGSYLHSGASASDYRVVIDGVSLLPLEVNATRLTVEWPHPRMPIGLTNVSVGNLMVEVGKLKIQEEPPKIPWAGIIASIAVFVLLLIIIIIVTVILLRRKKRLAIDKHLHKLAYKPGNVRYIKRNGELAFIPLSHLASDTELLEELKPFLIDKERLSLSTQLGAGQFGKVFKGTIQFNDGRHTTVAAKTLKFDVGVTEEIVCGFLKEATLMSNFNHANVLTLIGVVYAEGSMPIVVLPFMDYGDIRGLLHRDDEVFVLGDLLHFGMQIARGMEYLAERRFIHRDLAARNCMVNSNYVVKIADFGLSHDIYEDDYYRTDETSSKPLPVKWMAIESLNTGKFTTHSDVWSYGVVMWELLTRGVTPYPTVSNYEVKSYLKDGNRLPQPPYCPDFVHDMMNSCWQSEPTYRPTFKELADKLSAILNESNYEERSKTKQIKSDYYLQPISQGDFNELYLQLVE